MNLVRGSTYANSAHYRGRVSVFETSPICPDCVIFVGAVGGSIIGTAVVPFHTRLSRRGTTLDWPMGDYVDCINRLFGLWAKHV
ncbi:MAG: hypothetical protein WCL57_12980 [Chloroflexota bacterium]|jgi:hypothetical protein|nr:hypothetical protein [Chloroflexota bacterium]